MTAHEEVTAAAPVVSDVRDGPTSAPGGRGESGLAGRDSTVRLVALPRAATVEAHSGA